MRTLILLECLIFNLENFCLEKGDFQDYSRENLSSQVVNSALDAMF